MADTLVYKVNYSYNSKSIKRDAETKICDNVIWTIFKGLEILCRNEINYVQIIEINASRMTERNMFGVFHRNILDLSRLKEHLIKFGEKEITQFCERASYSFNGKFFSFKALQLKDIYKLH